MIPENITLNYELFTMNEKEKGRIEDVMKTPLLKDVERSQPL